MRRSRPVGSITSVIASLALVASTAVVGALALGAVTVAPATAAAPAADRMPGDVPSKKTPWVLDGEVTKIVQVGGTMIAGGLFTQVADPMNGTPYARQNLFAFDATTGLVSQSFHPTVDGQVQQLLPGPTPDTVYVAGDFTKINGKGPNHLQLLDVTTGQAVTSFKAPSTSGGIETMRLLPGNRLFIGGFFTKIGGVSHGQLATLNATTGALDPFMDIAVSGHHNTTGSGAQAPVGPREAGVTPNGDRMVVVGNFRTAGGLARDQIVMLDLTGATATVATAWSTTGYTPICSPNAFDSYMRDVEMSPDGSFFVVATTGGPHSGTLCDTAARFETYAAGTTLTPTWTDTSGGDTLWGVEVTQSAVYVGGHMRWMNNPNGADSAGQGSVPRPGLVALDPQNGLPLKWNPGRNPRGEAAYEIYETDAGIWIVTDTDWVGDRRYQRPRIAFFPYAEGYNTASKSTGTLPGNVYIGAPASNADVLYRVNAGGSAIAATDGGPDWAADTSAAPSPLHNAGSSVSTYSSNVSGTVNVPSTTPVTVFNAERNDSTTAPEMLWSFPVATGTTVQVRLYFADRTLLSTRRFTVNIDGVTKLSSYSITGDAGGSSRGIMKSFDITSDGTVNVDFLHVTGNPLVDAIEIVRLGGTPNTTTANVVGFDGTGVTSQALTQTPGLDWTTVRNAVMIGRTLFYGQTDGRLYRRSFDGTTFGPATMVNPYVDPLWNTVETGSGPTGQTYTGVLPTWYTSQLVNVTGMFYANGRMYYTRSGQSSLYWRWFSPDSGIVGGVENTVTGGNVAWSSAKGMFLDGSTLYVVNGTNGQLLRIGFANGAPTGTSSVADSTLDWRGRAVFLASVLPNVAPSAAFGYDCTGLHCTFDAGASTDADGSIASYEWTFGDGNEAGSPTAENDYPATATYDVTLTVTDDGGLSSSTTKQVSVVKPNVPPTAAFTATCTYLECDVDATTSSDGDGTVAAYAWDFGDGGTGTGATPHHTYAAPGSYPISLVVTDDDDATDDASTTQVVVGAPAASTVSYVGGAVNQGNVATPNVTTPAGVAAGQRLLMALTVNSASRTLSDPAGVTGWTVLATTTSGSMQTRIYTKLADAADAGEKVTVTLDAAAKYTMTVAAYSGVRAQALVHAELAETVTRAGHTTPSVDAPAGSWVVSYWADKSSTTTGFALPGSVTARHALCSTGTAHVCSTLADSGGAVATGPQPGLTATADAASSNATTATVVLRTVEADQAPSASFTFTCTSAACDFDARGSSDPDGSVASYAWDFGDGGTATGATPTHDFVTSGTRDVTLTVTDDEGTTGSTVQSVAVVRTNAGPTAAFTQGCTYLVCGFDASASSDSDGTIEDYAWDFGDGETGTGVTPSHSYAAAGSYVVTLTVTDDDSGTGSATRTAAPVAVRAIAHVGSTVNQGNVSTPNTLVPAGTSAGDRMVLVLSLNNATTVAGAPTSGVTGWTLSDSAVSGTMQTLVFTRVAGPGDAGRTVRFAMDTAAKYTLTLATYSGDMLAPSLAKSSETVVRPGHTTPTLEAAPGDWAVSYWADKSSATTGFTLPGSVTQRQATCGTSTGRVCSVLADSGGPLPAGPYGGLVATADSASGSATAWTLLLRQAG